MLNSDVRVFTVGGLAMRIEILDQGLRVRRSAIAKTGSERRHRNTIERSGRYALRQRESNRSARLVAIVESDALLLDQLAVIGIPVKHSEAAADDGVVVSEYAPGKSEAWSKIQVVPVPQVFVLPVETREMHDSQCAGGNTILAGQRIGNIRAEIAHPSGDFISRRLGFVAQ